MRKILIYTLCGIVVIFIFLSSEIFKLPDNNLHVFFLDVGQGDSTLVQTPHGNLILIDGGPEDNVIFELFEILPFFRRTIDLVILTHPDKDHLEGLTYVLDRFNVKNVLLTGILDDNIFYKTFLEKLNEQQVPVLIAKSTLDFDLGDGVFLDTLYPFDSISNMYFADTNSSSIVNKLIFHDFEILFTGDLDTKTEDKLIQNNVPLKADVLKISHHGSKNGTSKDFLEAVSPETAIIQAGENNSYGHPHMEILENLLKQKIEIFRTDKNGRIEIKVASF